MSNFLGSVHTSGGILSYSTKDIDTGEAVAEGFSNKEQQGFIKDTQFVKLS